MIIFFLRLSFPILVKINGFFIKKELVDNYFHSSYGIYSAKRQRERERASINLIILDFEIHLILFASLISKIIFDV